MRTKTPAKRDEPIAELDRVTFRYSDAPGLPAILEDVSLTIDPVDFVGLIGPNGGGKTTLLKILLGLLEPRSGTVRVLGRPPREVSRLIGYVPQHAQIDTTVPATVRDVVLTGRLGVSSWGWRYGREHLDAAQRVMERTGVAELAGRRVDDLSGGQRQRVLIARALVADARILLLDEPMAGIDLHMEQGILEILRDLSGEMPILVVSHDIGFISTHVKRIACLNRRLVVHPADAVSPSVISEMYAGHGPVHHVSHQATCPVHHEDDDPEGGRA